jgi:hypothetical protein
MFTLSPDIVTVIKVHRLECLGHVVRLDGERTVSGRKPGGERKKGIPRLRQLDDVELDLRNMGVKRWRTRALYRTEWASIMGEAKAKLQGL